VLRYEVTDPKHEKKPDEFPTHEVFFKAGIYVIEYLCNLHLVKKERFQFMALPILIKGAEGSPCRAIAIID
jgi:kynurenine formamidase